MAQAGPPYRSPFAMPGGSPTVIPDIPISAVFLAIYLGFAIINMVILQVNLKRKHKFFFSGLLFGFSQSRVITFILRIALATRPNNTRLSLAASIFVNAGVLIIYITNVVFAQRILRAKQPAVGWHRGLSVALKVCYALVGVSLALIIYSVIQSAYTKDLNLLHDARDIQLSVSSYLVFFTTLPFWLLLAAHVLLPKSADAEVFGHGSMRTKVVILCTTTVIAVLISSFKTGTAFKSPRPAADPAWYQQKPAFYVFNFVLEVLILSIFTFMRIDKRFHIPDGSKGPGDYSRRPSEKEERSEGSTGADEMTTV